MKLNKIKLILMLILCLNSITVYGLDQEAKMKKLTVEEAVEMAKNANKRLENQGKKVSFSKADSKDAKEKFDIFWGEDFEIPYVNYLQKLANSKYEQKVEFQLKEQIEYDIEKQFDTILNTEDQIEVMEMDIFIEEEKLRQSIKKEQLGLISRKDVEISKISLDKKKQDLVKLGESLDAEYRKLNDMMGIENKNQRYILEKELLYKPISKNISIPSYVYNAINSDPNIWIKDETAKLQEKLLLTSGEYGGAPTYTEYKKRELGFEQGLSDVSVSKDREEQRIKNIYDNILLLEADYDKYLLELKEMEINHNILKKERELNLINQLALDQSELTIRQLKAQLTNQVRQHSKLKRAFERPYLEM